MDFQKKEAALIEYLDECKELLERFSNNLSAIEESASKDILAAIYRDIHTIKGSSQLFGFSQIGHVAHAMESCLDPVRKGRLSVSHALVDNLYAGADIISNLLQGIGEIGSEPDLGPAIRKVLPALISITETAATGTAPPAKDVAPVSDESFRLPSPVETATTPVPSTVVAAVPPASATMTDDLGITWDLDQLKKLESSKKEPAAEEIPEAPRAPETPIAVVKPKPEVVAKSNAAVADEQQSETIRVQVNLLDNLMNLVGELVLIRNQLLQRANSNDEDIEFQKISQRLNVLTAELQNEVMKTRMQPIGNILNKFTRVVRDLGKELGKKIELDLQGAETELDKTIIEAVKDPLTHIVRNAVDHGIESTEERKKAGKKETGSIRLKSYHESGQVIIEVIDDGRGLHREKIGSKAVEKGLITADVLAKMSEKEVQMLIFAPGFSTAAAVSNVSGRGVGMDVVKTNVERIGGFVDISSTPGNGTVIRLKIPLTLAIVPALIVRTEGQRYAIPQAKLVELLRIDDSEEGSEKIEFLQGRPILRLRGRLLPIVALSEVLVRSPKAAGGTPDGKHNKGVSNIVVLNADNFQFGLVVDDIEDSADIVVKPLSPYLKDLSVFSGAAIVGDGTVALIIDVTGMAETAHIGTSPADARNVISTGGAASTKSHREETCDFLLVDIGAPAQYAIPLTLVNRIEEFEVERYESAGEQRVVRYRDSLLPVFSLPDFLKLPFEAKKILREGHSSVVVIKRGDRNYGIEVRDIHDIVEVSAKIDQGVRDRPGILGTILVQNRVVVVVDILGMIDTLKSKFDVSPKSATLSLAGIDRTLGTKRSAHRILVVEDSAFFRSYVRQCLQDAGYCAEEACDGVDGYSKLENAPRNHFSLILSDIEMPLMDGIALVEKVRASAEFSNTPMIAITTRFSNEDVERGTRAGFTRYLEKLNVEKLISELDGLLIQKQKEELARAS